MLLQLSLIWADCIVYQPLWLVYSILWSACKIYIHTSPSIVVVYVETYCIFSNIPRLYVKEVEEQFPRQSREIPRSRRTENQLSILIRKITFVIYRKVYNSGCKSITCTCFCIHNKRTRCARKDCPREK